jgi:hypothetical protein
MGGKTTMAKPRRVSALSSVLKETQEYNKVSQEDEQVVPVEQETVNTEKQISVDTDKHLAVNTEAQKSVTTEIQEPVLTDRQKSAYAETQKSVETGEKLHKQTINISESLALRLKIHAAKKKDTIANIATRAFEKLLAEEE